MFFLLRVAFWLTVVLVLLPTGRSQPGAQVGATDAVVAASAAVSDMSGFCDRQPEACVVGGQAAAAIGQRAQAGAKMVYHFINNRMTRSGTGSLPERRLSSAHAGPALPGSQNTLTASDRVPDWRGPPVQTEAVPLPRPRKARRHQA
jgi:Family of unknown function (DUF5330)